MDNWPAVRAGLRIVCGLVVALLAGCGGSATTQSDTDYFEEYGGSVAVYDRIAALTDCEELQAEFNQAAENNDLAEPGTTGHKVSLGYMTAAEDRRQELGC